MRYNKLTSAWRRDKGVPGVCENCPIVLYDANSALVGRPFYTKSNDHSKQKRQRNWKCISINENLQEQCVTFQLLLPLEQCNHYVDELISVLEYFVATLRQRVPA